MLGTGPRWLRHALLLLPMAVTAVPAWQNLTAWLAYGRTQVFRTDFALYYVFSRIGLNYGWNRLYDLNAQKHVYDAVGPIWWFPLPYTPPMACLTPPLPPLPFRSPAPRGGHGAGGCGRRSQWGPPRGWGRF